MSMANRKSGRVALCATVGAIASVMLSAQSANADVITIGAFDTYVAGSNSWNGAGQYTTSYHYGSDAYGTDVAQLGNPYTDPTAGPQYQEPIFDFLLQPLPAGQQVVSAQVTVLFAGNGAGYGDFNADLDALSIGAYAPNNNQFQAAGALIAGGLVTPSSSPWTPLNTNATQSTALANYINTQGYTDWDMLTMRLAPESDPTGTYFNIGAADWSGMNPVLTLTTAIVPVPEPATLGLIGLGALTLCGRRLRRKA